MNFSDDILELNDKSKVHGEIYVITNIKNNKQYVGQTVSHRKNKGKYRPFGYQGRFRDHISEAINNTKHKQCTYLNNSIRKYGAESFKVDLIKICSVGELNNLEQNYIIQYDSLYPNGYNLTEGGKTSSIVKLDKTLNSKRTKRGRDFGYHHKDSTRAKMSERLKDHCSSDVVKNRMRSVMKDYYDNQKIEILREYDLDDDFSKYIKPVKSKETKEVHDYIIKIHGRKLTLYSTTDSLDEKYQRLYKMLEEATHAQKVKIVKMSESEMGDPQPSS